MKNKTLDCLIILIFFITSHEVYSQTNTLPENGNVGIGTTDPTTKLQVMGSAQIDSTLTVKDSLIVNNDTHLKQKIVIDGKAVMKHDAVIKKDLKVEGESILIGKTIIKEGDLIVKTLGDSTLQSSGILLVNSNGKIENGGNLKSLIYAESAGAQPCLTNLDGTPALVNPIWNNKPHVLYTFNPCISNVRVGIGLQNPTENLEVIGTGRFSNTLQIDKAFSIGTNPSTFSKAVVLNTNKPAALEISSISNSLEYNKLIFLEYTQASTELIKAFNPISGVVPFLLESSGRMLIHNGEKKIFQLNPDGQLYLRKVRLDSEAWADFVFDNEYKLLPIDSLEKYINENNHLPNVPTTEEVLKNGYDVSEMNQVLLQKVEELTLYIIQIQNEMNKLNETIEDLKK